MAAPKLDWDKLSAPEYVEALRSLGVDVNGPALQSIADGIFDRVAEAVAQGVDIPPSVWEMVDKSIEAGLDKGTDRILKSIVGGYRDGMIRRTRPPDAQEIWIAVADGNTCGDCVERHGEILPRDQWDAKGRPRQAATVCGGRCRCELLPYIGTVQETEPLVELAAYL
jgi:hypothetical protein